MYTQDDGLDFFGENESKRNRKYIVIFSVVFAVAAILGTLIFVWSVSSFGKIKNKSENSSGEKSNREVEFKAASGDLSNLVDDLNKTAIGSYWSIDQNASDRFCKSKIGIARRTSIECSVSISSSIVAANQEDLNSSIDGICDTMQKSGYFTETTLTSAQNYPQLDLPIADQTTVKEVLSYGRWKIDTCELSFLLSSGTAKSSFVTTGKLECSSITELNEKGHSGL